VCASDMAVSEEELRRYAWVREVEAWTVAVIDGMTVAEVVRCYGGDPDASVGARRYGDLGQSLVQVFRVGCQVVALENDGYSGAVEGMAKRCSVRGRFFSLYWNVNAFGLVIEAVGGALTAHFEHLYPFLPEAADQWDLRPEWAIGPRVDVESARAVCMALLEQRTGVVVEPEWLGQPRPAYQVPDPDVFLGDEARIK
jgi:uncharacterized protein DUF6461